MEKLLYIVTIICVISLSFNLFLLTRTPEPVVVEKKIETIKRDTIVHTSFHTDTIYIDREKIKKEYITRIERDTVWLADIPQTYEIDSTDYNLKINATKLYWYQLDVHHQETIPVYDKVETIVKEKKPFPIVFGIQVGAGYGFFSRKPDIYVGLGATYKF